MSISVSHISKSYGATPAVKDISFDIKAGEITGFLGPNGAGKSTCLQILMGLLEADQGSASILGLSVQSEIDTIKKQVGYLAEHNPLYPDMYVKEFLTFIGKIHQIPADRLKNRIKEVIELTGLTQEQADELAKSVPHNGGNWNPPAYATEAVRGELENAAEVLRGIADDCRAAGEVGQMLSCHRLANSLERMIA